MKFYEMKHQKEVRFNGLISDNFFHRLRLSFVIIYICKI